MLATLRSRFPVWARGSRCVTGALRVVILCCASGELNYFQVSDDDVKKKVALAMPIITGIEGDIEASAAKVRAFKRQIIASNSMLTGLASSSSDAPTEIWAYPRHACWFESTLPNLGDQNFHQSFRVSNTTFKYLVDVCRPTMERQTTNMREAVPVDKRVSVAL
ncbi:hypothetical protein HPB49_015118 [Dermacentor silvarum]|uniref:Uncharacterized protein n=1 Tax=Dermacentor silvarum TaxID=543639 RepID=A0ACB8CY40_DERSI|nr:hypothetical protein HPB49_015118 [Dermacentor silvarum]